MVLLAAALARVYFGAAVPDAITSAERDDPKKEPMVQCVMAHWPVRKPGVSHCNRLSLDGLRLHDGAVRRVWSRPLVANSMRMALITTTLVLRFSHLLFQNELVSQPCLHWCHLEPRYRWYRRHRFRCRHYHHLRRKRRWHH